MKKRSERKNCKTVLTIKIEWEMRKMERVMMHVTHQRDADVGQYLS